MTTQDNLTESPVVDKPEQAEKPSETIAETIVSPQIPEKYKGKSLEDIIKMHKEAEKKISELGSEKRLLNEQLLAVTSVPAPAENNDKGSDYASEEETTEIDELKLSNRKNSIALNILMARQNPDMPEWEKYEAEVIELARKKPYLLVDPEWTSVAYKQIMADKTPEKLEELRTVVTEEVREKTKKEIEEAKKMEEAKKIEEEKITTTDAGLRSPVPKPEATPDRATRILDAKYTRKAGAWTDLIIETLSADELGVKK